MAMISVLSALARLDVDPWQEAVSLARMPRETAAVRLTALIDALPNERTIDTPAKTIAAGLIALLPRSSDLNVRSPHSLFVALGPRQTQIRIGVCALAVLIAIVFALSTNLSPGSGNGAKPSAPRAADATTGLPRKLDP